VEQGPPLTTATAPVRGRLPASLRQRITSTTTPCTFVAVLVRTPST